MFTHSPEHQPQSIEATRDTKIAIAVGILSASVNAMESYAATAEQVAREAMPLQQYDAPQYVATPTDPIELQNYYRKQADRAYNAHGAFNYPAEDMTPEVLAFRESRTYVAPPTEAQVTNVVSFPEQLKEHNPIIRKAA